MEEDVRMRLIVCINTAGAEDGYEEDSRPSYQDHVYEIGELLRMGHYDFEYIVEARDEDDEEA